MTLETIERGLLVESLAGHDSGQVFVITQVVDDKYVIIANGAERKIATPKRKKIKHIKLLNSKIDLDAMERFGGITDGDLYKAIKANLNKIGG